VSNKTPAAFALTNANPVVQGPASELGLTANIAFRITQQEERARGLARFAAVAVSSGNEVRDGKQIPNSS